MLKPYHRTPSHMAYLTTNFLTISYRGEEAFIEV